MTRAIGPSQGINTGSVAPTGAGPAGDGQRLREACIEFEAFFLREILKGLKATAGPAAGALGGGPAGADVQAGLAEDQFSVWLARSGGVGLAEVLYESLVRRMGDVAFHSGG